MLIARIVMAKSSPTVAMRIHFGSPLMNDFLLPNFALCSPALALMPVSLAEAGVFGRGACVCCPPRFVKSIVPPEISA